MKNRYCPFFRRESIQCIYNFIHYSRNQHPSGASHAIDAGQEEMAQDPTTTGMRETKFHQRARRPCLGATNGAPNKISSHHWHLAALRRARPSVRTVPTEAVFLGGEIIDPAYDSRFLLLEAGDIEVNPGPATRPRSSSTVERCSYCSDKFSNASVKLQCSTTGCRNKCHRFSCSYTPKPGGGFQVISRYMRGELHWLCHECGGPEPKTVPPPPPGVSHVICPGTNHKIPEISSKRLPSAITCDLCKKQFHQMCTGLGRDVIKAILDGSATAWICKSCNNPVNPNFAKPAVPINEISESQPAQTRDSIKIMQWNADGLKSKTVELEDRLNAENIDVCAIQETKMKKDDLSPTIKGYRPAGRNDRIEKKFGGVMFYVKDSLNFDPGQKSAHAGTESSTIRVKLSRAKWINISTVYSPHANNINKGCFCTATHPSQRQQPNSR